jgi:hypothetical protein
LELVVILMLNKITVPLSCKIKIIKPALEEEKLSSLRKDKQIIRTPKIKKRKECVLLNKYRKEEISFRIIKLKGG